MTLNVEGSSIEPAFQNLTGASYRCARTDNRTAADVLFALLSQNKYGYQGSGYYVTGITDPNGVTLSSGDKLRQLVRVAVHRQRGDAHSAL